MTDFNTSEAAKLYTCNDKLVATEYSSTKLAEAILKSRDPRIKTFDGDMKNYIVFKASFNKLERENIHSEDELLDLLAHITGKGEKAFQGAIPGSCKYQKALEILQERFGGTHWNSVGAWYVLK